MTSIAATLQGMRQAKGSIPKLCRALIGDWTDVPERNSGRSGQFHMKLNAYGNEVLGSIHVKPSNTWLRIKVTPAFFCGKGLVYERRGSTLTHVATVRLCHSKKGGTVLWQVIGSDLSGCLPQEILLGPHR